jgi:hypothetical protein
MPTALPPRLAPAAWAARTARGRVTWRWPALVAALAIGCMTCPVAASPAVQRGFDGPETTWQLLETDQAVRILDSRCDNDVVRDGTASERVVVVARAGESAYLACATGRMPVLNELQVRLWVRANRPGVRLAVRVVLPRSLDRATQMPQTVIVRGPACDQVDRWQQLSLAGIPDLLADEVRVLRARPGASVDPREAFVDAVVLLVPGGPRETVVWTDALEADGIVLADESDSAGPTLFAANASRPEEGEDRSTGWRQEPASSTGQRATTSPPVVRLQGTTLLVSGKPFVPRAIGWNGEPLKFLADRGFNTLVLHQLPTREQSAEARQNDLWFICIPPRPDELTQRGLGETSDHVLAWYFGDPLAEGELELEYVRRWVELVRRHDPLANRPILMAPQADWPALSKLADVLVAGHPRTSTMPTADFADWLEGRPRLARPGTPFWVQIPTQPGRVVQQQAQALAPTAQFPTSIDGPQLEALARLAGTRGCRGFLFQSNSPLNAGDESTRCRAALLELVNRQLLMIEPWLASGKIVGRVATADSAEAAAVLQVEQARLLIPLDRLEPQDAERQQTDTLTSGQKSLIVPGVPESNQVFLLSPAGLRPITHNRVAGGILVVFDGDDDALLLMTEDPRVIASFRQGAARVGQSAARLQRDLALAQGKQVIATDRGLEPLGWVDADARRDVAAAGALMKECDRQLSLGDMDRAYQLAGAARRLLSQAAVRQKQSLNVPDVLASSPLAVSCDTLAEQAALVKSSAALRSGENQLYGGDFEDLALVMQSGWQHVSHPLPGITAGAELSADRPQSGSHCLRLSAAASVPGQDPALVPGSPVRIVSPPVPVMAGQTLEISGWVRVPEPITGSVDGLQIVDSLGGAELAIAVRQTSDWQPFRMIRAVPESTAVTVAFVLTGLGSASVDAVMIRPLNRPAIRRLPPVAGGVEPRGPEIANRPQPLFIAPQQR